MLCSTCLDITAFSPLDPLEIHRESANPRHPAPCRQPLSPAAEIAAAGRRRSLLLRCDRRLESGFSLLYSCRQDVRSDKTAGMSNIRHSSGRTAVCAWTFALWHTHLRLPRNTAIISTKPHCTAVESLVWYVPPVLGCCSCRCLFFLFFFPRRLLPPPRLLLSSSVLL